MSKPKSDFSFYANDWLINRVPWPKKGMAAMGEKVKKEPKKAIRSKKPANKGIQGAKFVPRFPNQAKFLLDYRTLAREISQVDLGYECGHVGMQTARQAISDIERAKRPLLIQHAINLPGLDFAAFAKAYLLDMELNFLGRLRASGIDIGE